MEGKDHSTHSLANKAFKSESTTSWPKVKSIMQRVTNTAHRAIFKSSTRLPYSRCQTRMKQNSTMDKDKARARVKASKVSSNLSLPGRSLVQSLPS